MDAYLDHNATTPVRPEAARAAAAALARHGNASSAHRCGRRARRTLDDARDAVAALVGARPAEVTFTSGGTEANNQALRGFAGPVVVSAVEHDSVLGARPDAVRVGVDSHGVIVLDELRETLAGLGAPALVSVMHANNETGVLQPLAGVVEIARAHGARVHCDAIQAAGKLAVSFRDPGVDLMSLSAHKLGGPQGAGALVVRAGPEPEPLLAGGGQERGRRAGTENVSGIAGFGAAAAAAGAGLAAFAGLAELRDALEARIAAAVPDAAFHGAGAARLPNTSCIGLAGARAETQVMSLDLAGVAVSAGAACSSGKVAPSHVLRAMGQDADGARSAIRVSLGWTTRPRDIDRFLDAWIPMAAARAGGARPGRSAA